MGKKLQFNILFNARESILFATVFYVLHKQNALLDWVWLCVIFCILVEALICVIREKDAPAWSKAVLGCGICWAMLTIGLEVLDSNSSIHLASFLAVWADITLVLALGIILTIFVCAIVFAVKYKRGGNYTMSPERVVQYLFGDYLAVMLLLHACSCQLHKLYPFGEI